MRLLLPTRILRLSLAISVSLWMAGAGCLLGCSNAVKAAPEEPNRDTKTIVANDSCAAKRSHDCCAKARSQESSSAVQTPSLVPQVKSHPGMMENCPLAVRGSAVVSKARGIASDEALARDVPLVLPEPSNRFSSQHSNEPLLLNRGPTYLRCCVFLI